ncbi:hypothetical protein Acsp04_12560 [Actinomadura sp. NBRC 104425]|uniref:DUF1906 domain-containing protein n=1 Tax=Actinomadura sp. NBRC 104425 TaxID=3032204 RepID=UPI00249F9E57|nr:DUF1906 domain-containing protein [Actinomadura sp. NBRC 104425]GLZ11021.1 hypothetical protein Acsp04_12560 [Actinomadura sp. NBRC 104425]
MRHAAVLTGLLGATMVASLLVAAAPSVPRAEAGQAGRAGTAAGRLRVVEYRGVRVPVPAGWEVHWLDRDPTRCVRFDRHAVYLGRPGPQPDCPARAVGRTEALHVAPVDTAPDARQRRTGAVRPDRLARFTVPRDSAHEALLRLPEAGVRIHATYGDDPEGLERILRGTLLTPFWTRAYRPHVPGTAADDPPPGGFVPSLLEEVLPWLQPSGPEPTVPRSDEPRPRKPRAHKPRGHKPRPRKPRKRWVRAKGFDTCTAPSLAAMAAWRRSYKVANMYIGGAARACAQPNLNRAWVRRVRKMGYRLIPTYVGLQAPCTRFRQRFAPEDAAEEGRSAARDAVRRARALGIPRRNPVYFDMEVYDHRRTWCSQAVLTFLHHWTKTMRKLGYVPGFYSSAGSGVRDVGSARGMAKPKVVWFAHWDGKTDPYDCPYMSGRWWPPHNRIKQYRGGHRETHGGVTINVDNNMVDGRVY